MRETAVKNNIRNKIDSELWDEADGIITLATLDDDEEDTPLKKDGLRRQNTWSPQQRRREQQAQGILEEKSNNSNAYTATTAAAATSSRHPPEDDMFGSGEGNLPSTPRNGRPDPLSRKIVVDKNDPIEMAKSMMEKMQHRQRSADSLNDSRRRNHGEQLHFDTDMLRNLVIQTEQLKQKLTRSVEGHPPSPEKGLRLKLRTVESPPDDKLDLSPIRSSIDEDLRGLDRGLEYTPVIVA